MKRSGRRAFLFTPISQLKGGGGSTNTVYATGPAVPHGTISHVPAKPIADIPGLTPLVARNTNILINREEKHQLPGSYKLLQEQIQENQAKSNKNNSYNSCNNNSISNCTKDIYTNTYKYCANWDYLPYVDVNIFEPFGWRYSCLWVE